MRQRTDKNRGGAQPRSDKRVIVRGEPPGITQPRRQHISAPRLLVASLTLAAPRAVSSCRRVRAGGGTRERLSGLERQRLEMRARLAAARLAAAKLEMPAAGRDLQTHRPFRHDWTIPAMTGGPQRQGCQLDFRPYFMCQRSAQLHDALSSSRRGFDELTF